MNMRGANIWCKIHIPKFEALHNLKLCVDFQLIEANPRRIHTQLFEMTHNPSVHFPKLVNMTLDGESSLIALKIHPATDEAGQLHLKSLRIHDNDYDSSIWSTSFVGVISSVEDLTCPAKLLFGERLPWGESLCYLHITSKIEVEQKALFKLNHFKKLERLFTKYRGHPLGYDPNLSVEDFLANFEEARELPLTSITFLGPSMEEKKEEFIKYFPFPVRFHMLMDI